MSMVLITLLQLKDNGRDGKQEGQEVSVEGKQLVAMVEWYYKRYTKEKKLDLYKVL
uniref:Uncharacterized protein n=1 Tax=Romanomermis culicivorax TaxID=13658 RepID=A0A915IRU0_ROMCU